MYLQVERRFRVAVEGGALASKELEASTRQAIVDFCSVVPPNGSARIVDNELIEHIRLAGLSCDFLSC